MGNSLKIIYTIQIKSHGDKDQPRSTEVKFYTKAQKVIYNLSAKWNVQKGGSCGQGFVACVSSVQR